jgi:hypothetical protein
MLASHGIANLEEARAAGMPKCILSQLIKWIAMRGTFVYFPQMNKEAGNALYLGAPAGKVFGWSLATSQSYEWGMRHRFHSARDTASDIASDIRDLVLSDTYNRNA